MNILSVGRKVQILNALVEGNSIRSVERMTAAHRDTIMRVLCATGERCQALLDAQMRDIPASKIQCDEIWTFVGKKDKRLNGDYSPELGSQYVFVALEAESKLIPCFAVGKRDAATAVAFMEDLASRIRGRIQLTTDAFPGYLGAVDLAFGGAVDYAQLNKIYRANGTGREGYAPSDIVDVVPIFLFGQPNPRAISTSFVERQNLTLRMSLRRLTRLTNGFSKKLANLKAALALHFAWYNFGRVHRTLRVTPAMEAGITDHVWRMEGIFTWGG